MKPIRYWAIIAATAALALSGCGETKSDSSESSSSSETSSSSESSSSETSSSDEKPEITSFTAPAFQSAYLASRGSATDSKTMDKNFAKSTDVFTVGNLNAFKYLPIMKESKVVDGKVTTVVITSYHSVSTLLMKDTLDGTFATIDDVSKYCTISETESTYLFSKDAIGKYFSLSVHPYNDDDADHVSTFAPFKVEEGYNVYNGKDISIVTSPGHSGTYEAWDPANKIDGHWDIWKKFRQDNGIPAVYQGNDGYLYTTPTYDDAKYVLPCSIYFMNDVTLHPEDVSADCFWTEESLTKQFGASTFGYSNYNFYVSTYDTDSTTPLTYAHWDANDATHKKALSVIGSFRDENVYQINSWSLSKDMVMNGNYFTFTMSDPRFTILVDNEHQGTDRWKQLETGFDSSTAPISHASLFYNCAGLNLVEVNGQAAGTWYGSGRFVDGKNVDDFTAYDMEPSIENGYGGNHSYVRNIKAVGNAKKNSDPSSSGGLYFYKGESHNYDTIENCVLSQWFQAVTVSYFSYKSIDSCKMYDGYNTLVLSWGARVSIKDTILFGAGGPAILATFAHQGDRNDDHTVDAANRLPAQVTSTDCIIHSYLSATSPWFSIYGVSAMAASLIGLISLSNQYQDATHPLVSTPANSTTPMVDAQVVIDSSDNIGSTPLTYDSWSQVIENDVSKCSLNASTKDDGTFNNNALAQLINASNYLTSVGDPYSNAASIPYEPVFMSSEVANDSAIATGFGTKTNFTGLAYYQGTGSAFVGDPLGQSAAPTAASNWFGTDFCNFYYSLAGGWGGYLGVQLGIGTQVTI